MNASMPTGNPSMPTGQRSLLLLLLACFAVQGLYYFPSLPESVASHFGRGGVADRWTSKELFFGVLWGIALLMIAVFLALPRLGAERWMSGPRVPDSEYWDAPERRAATHAFLQGRLLLLTNLHLLLILSVGELAIRANLQATPRLAEAPMWGLMGAYGVALAAWIWSFKRRFRHPAAIGI